MSRDGLKLQAGLGLIELVIVVLISTMVLGVAYRVFSQMSRQASKSVREARVLMAAQVGLKRINIEISNIIVIPNKTECGAITPCASYLQNTAMCGAGNIAATLVPLPGYTRADVDSHDLSPIDPSQDSLLTDGGKPREFDAIRFVFFTQDSKPLFLARDVDGDQIQTQRNNPITLETLGLDLNKGDYIVLSDNKSADLARITDIDKIKGIVNRTTSSLWNQVASTHVYGAFAGEPGQARVQKVGIRTYAYDPTDKIVYVDDHAHDDGFSPTTSTFGAPGLGRSWSVLFTNIDRFQIEYTFLNPNTDDVERTRTPQASFIGNDGSGCENQIGNPLLRQVSLQLQVLGNRTEEEHVNPENLKLGLLCFGGGEDLERDPPDIIEGAAKTGSGGGGGDPCVGCAGGSL